MSDKNYEKPNLETVELQVEDIMFISDESERDEIFSVGNLAPERFN